METMKKVKLALLAMQRHSWEQGVTAQAFLEQGDEQTVIALAKEAAYRRLADGRAAVMSGTASTDPCSVGEAMLYALRATGDRDLAAACGALLDWALHKAPRNAEGIVYHFSDSKQFWVDSMYMLPPYLAAAGHYEEALRQINGYWAALHNDAAGLMHHMWDDAAGCFTRAAFWGVGNGWTVAGIARVIDLLPEEMRAERDGLAAKNAALIGALLRYVRADGLFHDVVDDSATFVETNLSQMLSYAIYRGIASGWLDSAYRPQADRMRDAACAKVDAYGLVRDVCGAPHFDKPGVAPEGNAFHLLMEAARAKL